MNWLRRLFGPAEPLRLRMLRAVLLTLLAAACGYRVWLVFQYNPIDALWSDPYRHWSLGSRPLDTQPFAAIDPVGYQIYLAALAKLTGGARVLVAYWTALLSLAAPWFWYRFLRELLPSRDWALAGWVGLAALPSWSGIYSFFMQETLMLPLLGAALWLTWRCRRKQDLASFLAATALWMLAGLTRGICIPLAAVAMTWLWLEQSDRWRKAALALLLLFAVLGPLAGRSWYLVRQVSPHGLGTLAHLYSVAGTQFLSITFTRGGGQEQWHYRFLNPSLNERPPFAPLSDWRGHRLGTAQVVVDLDAGRRDWQAALDRMPPWTLERYAWLTGENLVFLFFTESWPDSPADRAIGTWNFLMRWIWAPLGLLVLVWTMVRRPARRERLLPALLLTWFVVQGLLPIAVNEGRYRKPFEGLVIAQWLLLASAARRRTGADPEALRPPNAGR